MNQPDIDICTKCGEHCDFVCCENASDGKECDYTCQADCYSNCCGAGAIDTDPDIDVER